MNTYTTYSDEHLLQLLKNSDETAFEEIYARYWQPLYSSAFQLLQNTESCKDIIQELFIDLWQRRKFLEVKISFKGYLFTAVKYKVLKEIRNSQKTEFFENLDDKVSFWTGDSNLLSGEIGNIVKSTVESLPEGCKEIYTLSRDHDLTHAQIAAQLGISTKTVANQLTKALRHIRISLAQILTSFLI